MGRRCNRVIVVGLAALLTLCWGGAALAIVEEFEHRQAIGSVVSVLRYINRQVQDYRDKVKMVDYSIKETQAQLDLENGLIERESKSDDPKEVKDVKLAQFARTKQTLELQLKAMTAPGFQKTFNEKIAEQTKELEKNRILLDAKVMEYRVLFGGEPPVSLEYVEKESRYRPKTEQPGKLVVR